MSSCTANLLPCSETVTGNLFLIAVYGAILAGGSKVIADGSELLLEILDPGFIGGFLLPVLGALPDTLVIVMSCLGTLAEAQAQIDVGMGTLAGSTIMLLTVPWFGSLLLGRCDIVNGKSVDSQCAKFNCKRSWSQSGVSVDADVPQNAMIMLITAFTYVIVQGPAFSWAVSPVPSPAQDHLESGFALAGFIMAAAAFVGYSVFQVLNARQQSKRAKLIRQQAMVAAAVRRFTERLQAITAPRPVRSSEEVARVAARKWLRKGTADAPITPSSEAPVETKPVQPPPTPVTETAQAAVEEASEDDPKKHKGKIAGKSVAMMLIGTVIVSVFSDPMVDVISEFSVVSGLPAFYVSFVITPLASNASEVISGLLFARKKKSENLSISYGQLYGAATMNNTLCLGVFCAFVYFRGLTWSFSAEVVAILVVTAIVGIMGLRRTLKLWMIWPNILMYPMAIALVALMENVGGWK